MIKSSCFQIVPYRESRQDAFAKAPGDIVRILGGLGFKTLNLDRRLSTSRVMGVIGWPIWALRIAWNLFVLPRASWVVIQLPSSFYDVKIHPILHLITVIRDVRFLFLFHDLSEIQHADDCGMKLNHATKSVIVLSEKIVVHNHEMALWLNQRGVDMAKMIELGIFDYLYSGEFCRRSRLLPVVIAGMISQKKCGYLRDVKKLGNLKFKLYGPCNDRSLLVGDNIEYMGSFSPDELPSHLEGGWGLVWDSQSVRTCEGPTGNYLRYNNPHKASLYLCAHLPLIVWSESALAGFVQENHLGICVSSLHEVKTALDRLSDEDYDEILKHVDTVASALSVGGYTKAAMQKAGLW